MNRFAILLMILAPATVNAADDKPTLSDGTYKVIGIIEGGKKVAKPSEELTTVIIKDGKMTFKGKKDDDETFTLKVDAKPKVATLDFTVEQGPDKGSVNKGIWKEEKGKLTIAFSLDPKGKRPESFDAPGKDIILLELTKEVKKEK